MVYPFCVFIIVKGYNMGFGSSSYTNILSEFKIRLSGIFIITIALVF
ncbi:hypothetical protein JCM19538_3123 [Jejuia pallidilutea]|nr:hypothetical protein JCM19538_3123 [Jejuia pallidilutea]